MLVAAAVGFELFDYLTLGLPQLLPPLLPAANHESHDSCAHGCNDESMIPREAPTLAAAASNWQTV